MNQAVPKYAVTHAWPDSDFKVVTRRAKVAISYAEGKWLVEGQTPKPTAPSVLTIYPTETRAVFCVWDAERRGWLVWRDPDERLLLHE